jgi:CheY-like chemotaxis protein
MSESPSSPGNFPSYDVLVIDDDPGVRSVIRRFLERSGHVCREAADGNLGLALLRGRAAELVIVDMLMPEKEGAETIREIRSHWPGIPVIAMSGGGAISADDCLRIARALGAERAIRKPFDLKDLQTAIDSLMSL